MDLQTNFSSLIINHSTRWNESRADQKVFHMVSQVKLEHTVSAASKDNKLTQILEIVSWSSIHAYKNNVLENNSERW